MDGILNINKPWGMTSFSLVAMVKRLTRERRVGHAGTLDPTATGVLPVCLGQGTRVIEFLVDSTKAYLAEIEFGIATDTYDASGKIIQKDDPSGISRDKLESMLTSFCGPGTAVRARSTVDTWSSTARGYGPGGCLPPPLWRRRGRRTVRPRTPRRRRRPCR